MEYEKYNPNSLSVSAILGLIKAGDIAIPEIQRPFVWRKAQVRDLLDSLYKGYPTGYLIIWKNPNVKLKDGSYSKGKRVLIDGQQRVTAIMTAIAGETVYNADYKRDRVKISFNPFEALSEDKEAKIFEVQGSGQLNDKRWIPDIAEVFKTEFSSLTFINKYCADNPDMNPQDLEKVLTNLKMIGNRLIGTIELHENLDIDVVTDIFIRINSQGTTLSQGDFVMSKIASDDTYGGNELRKAIDYFSHLCVDSDFYNRIAENDEEFAKSEYFPKLSWLKDDKETVYDPACDDVIRVAFMHMYPRAKLADLVSLLSGRDFLARDYKVEIMEDTYSKLKTGVKNMINENNFTQFMMAIRGAGFISPKMVGSNMAIDFAYALYLMLSQRKEVEVSEIKKIVQRWYVLSVLTGRYSSSPESAFYRDIKRINEVGIVKTLEEIEDARLSKNFWEIELVQNLQNTSTKNPTYLVYLAAQVANNDYSLLSNNITVRELISMAGDVHHIFPKQYLKEKGLDKNDYNQLGNYAFLDTQVNKSIGKKSPSVYFKEAFEQCETDKVRIGSITDKNQLLVNLKQNCIPENVLNMEYGNYEEFLEFRRKAMAKKIEKFYLSL